MNILTSRQRNFLNYFFESYLGKIFFLTGGTALAAFYLKHRLSEDLDIFTVEQEINFDSVNAEMRKIIKKRGFKTQHEVISPTYLQYILTSNNQPLKIDFVKDVPIHFGKIKIVDKIRLDSIENIAVNKLLALFGRADAKDFFDLYFLIKVDRKFSQDELFEKACKKDKGLHEFYLAEMLSRVTELKKYPKMIRSFDKQGFVKFFQSWSNNLYKKIKPKG